MSPTGSAVRAPQVGPVQAAEEAEVIVGHQLLHDSHVARFLRGIWWCQTCGAYCTVGPEARTSAKGLARPCRGEMGKAGRDYARRLEQGLPPKHGMFFPLP